MNLRLLNLLIKEGEGLTTEFKERFTPRIDQDIVAFANSKGGKILLGITDNGNLSGEKLTNHLKSQIISLGRNCDPNISVSIKQVGNVVLVEVPEGDEKPYSCSSGYFKRLDAVTQKMSKKELELIFEKFSKVPFEEKINKDIDWKDISREKVKSFLRESHVQLSSVNPKEILDSLNLSKNNQIKNAGVLFFAKLPRRFILQAQMTLIAFKGTERIHIYDRKDIQDDLLTQFNEAMIFLQKHLNVRSEIKGVNRKDIYEIPLEALREVVANAIIHRDYRVYGTSLMVEVNDDSVVISNPGGLPFDFNKNKIGTVSIRRNELIADMFARMDKAERVGTGFKRIKYILEKVKLPFPDIESDTFCRVAFKRPVKFKGSEKSSEKGSEKTREKIIDLIKENQHITTKEIADALNLSTRAVEKQISALKEERKLKRIGPDKGGSWKV